MAAPDQMLGAYKLIALVGAGGMGEVWKAEDTRLGRLVAIKILPQQIASDAEAIARMRREARTAAGLYHPNIATIHSFEEAEGRTFIVMEFVEGEPLTALIKRGPLPENDVCRIGRGVAEALAEAHEQGIVHRDIKPDNIIVRGQRVKVLDFGIAKRVGVETTSSDAPTTFLTQEGMIVGTIHYMSPEQALGKQLDARTDIFSLGVVLYQAATGTLPFSGETMTETITQIIRDEPKPPRVANPAITPGLAALIERCMKKNRDERIGSAAEVSKELDKLMAVATTEPMTVKTAAMTAPLPKAGAAPTVIDRAPAAKAKRHVWPAIAIVFVLLIAGAIAAALLRKKTEAPQPQPSPKPVAATTAPSTASVVVVDNQPGTVVATTTVATAQPSNSATQPPSNPATPQPETTSQQQPQADKPSATVIYARALDEMMSGHPDRAHRDLIEALVADPHFAKANFRLGELALFRRETGEATDRFNRALTDGDSLDTRERALCNLGLAVARDDRVEAVRLAREIHRANPGDPDLAAFHRQFGQWFGRADEPQPRPFPRRRFRP